MKNYSRESLIEFFSSFSPDDKPCAALFPRCPIGVFLGLDDASEAAQYDRLLAAAVDAKTRELKGTWGILTAKQIVDIAKGWP